MWLAHTKATVNVRAGYVNAAYASGMWISTTWHGTHPQKVDAKREAKMRAAHV